MENFEWYRYIIISGFTTQLCLYMEHLASVYRVLIKDPSPDR